MNCDICKKEVGKTNIHSIRYGGDSIRVCGKHYAQYIKYKKFLDNSPKTIHDSNTFDIVGDYTRIFTRRKDGSVSSSFIIDTDDLDRVIVKKWRCWKGRYFTGVKKPIYIGNFILQIGKDSEDVEYINHDPSDNRRANLRIAPLLLCELANSSSNKEIIETKVAEKMLNKYFNAN